MAVSEVSGGGALDLEIVVPRRFRGPPQSGNGGYVAGVLARHVGGTAEITLRAPIPLDRALRLREAGGEFRLTDEDRLVATVCAGTLPEMVVPQVPDRARVASLRLKGGSGPESDYFGCFVCGHGREPGEGLRVHARRLPEGTTAVPVAIAEWTPHPDFAGPDGYVPDEFLWGALDCPGATAVAQIDDPRVIRTGRMCGVVEAPVRAGEDCRVVAWKMGEDGRKLYSGTALVDSTGRVCAKAYITWIALKP